MAKKKRYSQSSRDKMDERQGMEGYYDKSYRGMSGSDMIHEDKSASSNLPTSVVERSFQPKRGLESDQAENILGNINRQMDSDHNQLMRQLKLQKY